MMTIIFAPVFQTLAVFLSAFFAMTYIIIQDKRTNEE